MDDPWGFDDPPAVESVAPLPPRLVRLAEVQQTRVPIVDVDLAEWGFPDAEELPEVQALAADGWRALEAAPLYCLLPAAWPAAHRTWVPDRLPRVSCGGTTATYYGTVMPPPDEDDETYWEADTAAQAAREAGLPPPPSGRIWLVRSPWPRLPVAAIHELIWERTEQSDHHGTNAAHQSEHSELVAVYRAAHTVFGWDEEAALAACPAELRGLLDAWAAAGRVGEAAGPFVERHLTPGQLDRFMQGTGLDDVQALAWLHSLDDLDEDAIAFVTAWRAAGIPGNPPADAYWLRERDPAELRQWLDAGFDLHAAAKLELAGLDTALRWRQAGFSPKDTYELLRDDPDLTPEQAHTFDTGPAREHRRGWIYFGFDAEQAAAWATAGVTPSVARIWRACGKTPTDVQHGQRFRHGQRFPPELTAGKKYIAYSGPMDSEYGPYETSWDELPDPPGTRGRRARRWAHDPHPWINTD